MVSFPGVMVVSAVDSSGAGVSAAAQPVRANAAMAAAAIPALMRDSVLFLDMVYISFCLCRIPTYLGIDVVIRIFVLEMCGALPPRLSSPLKNAETKRLEHSLHRRHCHTH
jgi:hypothetical protein